MNQSARKFLIPAVLLVLTGTIGVVYLVSRPPTIQEEVVKDAWIQEGNLYRTTLNYPSPGGDETNEVTITLSGQTITDVKVVVVSEIAASIRYQQQFAEDIRGILIGKNISELEAIDKVSGATLTSDAFNEAIKKLQLQLKS